MGDVAAEGTGVRRAWGSARTAGTAGTARAGRVATVLVVALIAMAACTPVTTDGTSSGPGGPDGSGGPIADPALVALNILPPGNGYPTGATAANGDDQRVMYDGLDDPVADHTLTDADLGRYFTDEHLGAGRIVRVDHPRDGVRIEWDATGVPHVYGDTADDVAYGAGWAVADARLLIAELGRILGRAGAIETAGGGGDLVSALAHLSGAPHLDYTDAELERNLQETVANAGPDGPHIASALDSFTAGMNRWLDTNTFPPQLRALGLTWRHWSRDDVLAVGIVVDDIFGAGGGDEVGNAAALGSLVRQLGTSAGRRAYDTLREADDPAATNQVDRRFDYPQFREPASTGAPVATNVVDPAAVAIPDVGADGVAVASPPAETLDPPAASNFLAVAGSRTRSGHPVLVGGPQTSYVYPELLFEIDLHGGGYDARGVTFPGLGPWVVIGRSASYGWTATAGGSDLTDERAELLCEPDGSAPTLQSTAYEFDGRCTPMTRPDGDALTAWRTVHGPVLGRTYVGGRPVAIARQRMSRFQTAEAARAFWALNMGRVTAAADFAPTMSSIPMSFNWAYVNATDIAYFHSGYYPVRAAGVDSDLPSWGTGQWEWQGRLDWRLQPQEIDPPSGLLVSWNNKVAPGWRTADNDWGVGAGQRVDLIAERAARLHDATVADVVSAVQDAGTADLRGEQVVPPMVALLGATPAPDAHLAAVATALATWASTGAHRRDRNADGFYDDPMVPVMGDLFARVVAGVFEPGLGAYFDDQTVRRPNQIDFAPALNGSAFSHGWYSLVARDLRRVAGTEAVPAGEPLWCGGGDRRRCSTILWAALGQAVAEAGPFLQPTVFERIRFLPLLFIGESIRWVNRSTYQQVLSFGAGEGSGPAPSTTAATPG